MPFPLHRFFAFVRSRTPLPVALLLALLQRTPEIPRLAVGGSMALRSPGVATMWRTAFLAAGSLGTVHSLAGASVLASSTASPLQTSVGVPITPVGFTITGTGAVGSWELSGAFPPGLKLMDPNSGTFITAPGVLDAAIPITSLNGTSTPSGNVTPVLVGTPTQVGDFVFHLQAWQFGQRQGVASGIFDYVVHVDAIAMPVFLRSPEGVVRAEGDTASLEASAPAGMSYVWTRNGSAVPDSNRALLSFPLTPFVTGVYTATISNVRGTATSAPVIVGVTTTRKVVGDGTEIASNIHHPSGNIFDQVLLAGPATLLTAEPGKVTRASCVDGNDDIVQIEFSGAGTLSIFLEDASAPAAPTKYSQPGIAYVKGNLALVVADADETTNLAVFSVGRITAFNSSLFREDVTYDGVADLAFIAIHSRNGKFGGVRAANARFSGTGGIVGLFAPGVYITGPAYLGNVRAFEAATPMIVVGAVVEIRITGGDLRQPNGRAIQVARLPRVQMADGSTSHGVLLPAQVNQGRLEEDGIDVTRTVVIDPGH